ncbi:hypothetical protein D3C80_1244010 [compost metagenome]
MGLPGLREILGTHPLTDFDENGAMRFSPGMAGCQAARTEMCAGVAAAEYRHRNRRIGRAKNRRTRIRYRFARQFGHDCQSSGIRCLALVSCHTKRGPALEMLDGPHVFLMGELDVLDRDVVLEIDPGAPFPRDMPQGLDADLRILGLRQGWPGCGNPHLLQSRYGSGCTGDQRRPCAAFAGRRPCNEHMRGYVAGQECL